MSATVLGNLRSNRDTNCGTEGWLMLQTEILGRQKMHTWFGIIEEDDSRNSYQMSVMYDRQSDFGRLPES